MLLFWVSRFQEDSPKISEKLSSGIKPRCDCEGGGGDDNGLFAVKPQTMWGALQLSPLGNDWGRRGGGKGMRREGEPLPDGTDCPKALPKGDEGGGGGRGIGW